MAETPQREAPGAAAIILAGGKSTRLGRDKASEVLLGVSMLQRVIDRLDGLVDEYVIVRAQSQQLPATKASVPITIVEDTYPATGPLGGIYTGLDAMRATIAFVTGCDMPLLQPSLAAEIIRLAHTPRPSGRGMEHPPTYDLVVPVSNTFLQPLCAVYSEACLQPIRDRLEAGLLSVTGFIESFNALYVQPDQWLPFDPNSLSFINLNHESDLERAEALLEAEASRQQEGQRNTPG